MKSQNKSRLKALGIDLATIFFVWIVVYLFSELFFKTHVHHFFRHQLRMAMLFSFFLCKDLIHGQSIGKRICHLKVVSDKGKSVNPFVLFFRNVFVVIFFVEIIFLISGKKRTGDIVFNTSVVPVSEKNPPVTLRQVICWVAFFIGSIVAYFLLAYVLIRVAKVL